MIIDIPEVIFFIEMNKHLSLVVYISVRIVKYDISYADTTNFMRIGQFNDFKSRKTILVLAIIIMAA